MCYLALETRRLVSSARLQVSRRRLGPAGLGAGRVGGADVAVGGGRVAVLRLLLRQTWRRHVRQLVQDVLDVGWRQLLPSCQAGRQGVFGRESERHNNHIKISSVHVQKFAPGLGGGKQVLLQLGLQLGLGGDVVGGAGGGLLRQQPVQEARLLLPTPFSARRRQRLLVVQQRVEGRAVGGRHPGWTTGNCRLSRRLDVNLDFACKSGRIKPTRVSKIRSNLQVRT